jgi:hypothetical protein
MGNTTLITQETRVEQPSALFVDAAVPVSPDVPGARWEDRQDSVAFLRGFFPSAGQSYRVLVRTPNRQMDICLADVLLEWERSASRSTSTPLVVTPDFLEDVGEERAKMLFSRDREATRHGEISSALPDNGPGFLLSNARPTDIEVSYV